jgi:hypothetical protein
VWLERNEKRVRRGRGKKREEDERRKIEEKREE